LREGREGRAGSNGTNGSDGAQGDKGDKGNIGELESQVICVAEDEKLHKVMYWGGCEKQELVGEEFTILKNVK
jgi:hypothetical protein